MRFLKIDFEFFLVAYLLLKEFQSRNFWSYIGSKFRKSTKEAEKTFFLNSDLCMSSYRLRLIGLSLRF